MGHIIEIPIKDLVKMEICGNTYFKFFYDDVKPEYIKLNYSGIIFKITVIGKNYYKFRTGGCEKSLCTVVSKDEYIEHILARVKAKYKLHDYVTSAENDKVYCLNGVDFMYHNNDSVSNGVVTVYKDAYWSKVISDPNLKEGDPFKYELDGKIKYGIMKNENGQKTSLLSNYIPYFCCDKDKLRVFNDNAFRSSVILKSAKLSEVQEILAYHNKTWDIELKELVNIKWKPSNGEDFLSVNSYGDISTYRYSSNDAIDNALVNVGNCFKPGDPSIHDIVAKIKDLYKNK